MSFDDFIKKNRNKFNLVAGFALVFILGFACGFYYLENNRGEGLIEIIDSSGDCSSFFKSGSVKSSMMAPAGDFSASQTPDSALLESSGGVVDSNTEAKLFAASKNSTLYHSRDCQYVKQIKDGNAVWFSSRQEAEAAGKKPHSCVE
ncbi:MAG: hypothetical protein PHI66_04950 [Candidatus Pacebacteria bacterium]|nr:hypothetical protein [Candidatus Paceibacterota bacterium]